MARLLGRGLTSLKSECLIPKLVIHGLFVFSPITFFFSHIQLRRGRRIITAMKLNTLKDLYIHQLKDLYNAEKQLIKALPKMAKAATNKKLRQGFELHLEETKEHANRLEGLLSSHNQTTRGPKCKAMEGLIEEGKELMEEEADPEVLDAGLICAAQRVEHYEIAGYGCARSFAELIGDKEGQKILQKTLDEEGATDKKLTDLALSEINVSAVE